MVRRCETPIVEGVVCDRRTANTCRVGRTESAHADVGDEPFVAFLRFLRRLQVLRIVTYLLA